MLDTEYILAENITENNLTNIFTEIGEVNIDITNMYVAEKDTNIALYFVEGKLRDEETSEVTDFRLMVRIDRLNRTFGILTRKLYRRKLQ